MNYIDQLDTYLLEDYFTNLGKAIVEQMLDLYIKQSAIYLNEINQTIEDESQSSWEGKCHKMKGAAGSIGLVKVHAKLVAIEKSTDNWEVNKRYFDELCNINQISIESFSQWLLEK